VAPKELVMARSKASRESIAERAVQRHGSKRSWKQRIKGGTKRPPADFDPIALYRGVIVELEHTVDPCVALEIAMDHLDEDPKYYGKLATIHVENPGHSANPSGYSVLAKLNKWQWPIETEVVTRDESDARVRSGRSYEPLFYAKTREAAQEFADVVNGMTIEVSRLSDGTVVYRGSLLGFSDDEASVRLPFRARSRLFELTRTPESRLGTGKSALVARRIAANPSLPATRARHLAAKIPRL